MGVPIALWFFIKSVKFAGHEYDLECDFAPLFCILTYLIATNVINYGEGQIWRKWLGRDGCWLFYGFCFGLASFPVLGWWAILQAVIASYSFWFLMQLSSEGKLDHAYVEVGIGFMGTIMYLFA